MVTLVVPCREREREREDRRGTTELERQRDKEPTWNENVWGLNFVWWVILRERERCNVGEFLC